MQDQENKPKRDSQVTQELKIMERELGRLCGQLDMLNSNLATVVLDHSPLTVKDNKEQEQKQLVPLAKTLQDNNSVIKESADLVATILQGLEL